MEEKPNYEKDLAAIRNIMERSSKFISLSGLAGVMAGFYALGASAWAYHKIYSDELSIIGQTELINFILVALLTLFASLATGLYFSHRKARKAGSQIWNATSRHLLLSISIPLGAGGAFALICLMHGYVGLIAPICLLFYGLALLQASKNLFEEIRYLGYSEVLLGILSAIFISYGLLFWAIGFGVLHIVYGVLMYRKYEG